MERYCRDWGRFCGKRDPLRLKHGALYSRSEVIDEEKAVIGREGRVRVT